MTINWFLYDGRWLMLFGITDATQNLASKVNPPIAVILKESYQLPANKILPE